MMRETPSSVAVELVRLRKTSSSDAGDELDRGAFAGAVGSEEANDLALVQGERDVVQHLGAVVAEDDLFELHHSFRQVENPPASF